MQVRTCESELGSEFAPADDVDHLQEEQRHRQAWVASPARLRRRGRRAKERQAAAASAELAELTNSKSNQLTTTI